MQLLHQSAINCMCIYASTMSVMYEIISRLNRNQHVYVSHRPCLISAPPTIYAPHGCTLIIVFWASFLNLCYSCSLILTLQLPSVLLSVLSICILFLCCFCLLFSVTLSSLSLLRSMVKCSGLAAAQPFTACLSFYFSESHRLQYCRYCCLVVLFSVFTLELFGLQ